MADDDSRETKTKIMMLDHGVDFNAWHHRTGLRLIKKRLGTVVKNEKAPAADAGSDAEEKQLAAWAEIAESLADSFSHIAMTAAEDAAKGKLNPAHLLLKRLKESSMGQQKVQLQDLLQKWSVLQSHPGESMASWVSRVEEIRDRMKAMNESRSEVEVVLKVVNGIIMGSHEDSGSHFAFAKGTIMNDANKTVGKARELLLNAEQLHKTDKTMSSNLPVLFGGRGAPGGGGVGVGSSGGGGAAGSGDRTCFYCDKPGHVKIDCFKFQNDEPSKYAEYAAKLGKKSNGFTSGGAGGRSGGRSGRGGRGGRGSGKSLPALVSIEKAAFATSQGGTVWVWDSGAAFHITCEDTVLQDIDVDAPTRSVKDASGKIHMSAAMGTVELKIEGLEELLRIENVYLMPTLSHNLISSYQCAQKGFVAKEDKEGLRLSFQGQLILKAPWEGNVPVIRGVPSPGSVSAVAVVPVAASVGVSTAVLDLHASLGHLSRRRMTTALKYKLITGTEVTVKQLSQLEECKPCILGGQVRLKFPESSRKGTHKVGELLHMDICGPFRNVAVGGFVMFLNISDDASGLGFIQPLRNKDAVTVSTEVKKVVAWYERQSSVAEDGITRRVKTLRCDRGREFLNEILKGYLSDSGIQLETSTAYTSQQNGVAERRNGVLTRMVRIQLVSSGLGPGMWAELLQASNYQLMRSPSRSNTGNMSPYQMFYGRVPDISNMHPIGTDCFVLKNPPGKDGKLMEVSEAGQLVGYSLHSKAWRIRLNSSRVVVESRDVRFLSTIGGRTAVGATPQVTDLAEVNVKGATRFVEDDDEEDEELPELVAESDDEDNGGAADDGSAEGSAVGGIVGGAAEESGEKVAEGRPRRATAGIPPQRFMAGVAYSPYMVTGAEVTKSDRVKASDIKEPQSISEALEDPVWGTQWSKSMDSELQSMIDNGVMQPVGRLPAGKRSIPCKIVFKVKSDPKGYLDKLKSRLVALGYRQVPGVDFQDLFAPVSKLDTVRVILALAAAGGLETHQLDVRTAFLQAPLEEELYIHLPGELPGGGPDNIYRLRRAIYGLKQAPRAWYQKLRVELEGLGFAASISDPALFIRHDPDGTIIVCHVDDMIIAGIGPAVDEVKKQIGSVFDVTDMGSASFYLAMEIDRDRNSSRIMLSQRRYTEEMLVRFNYDQVTPVSAPSEGKLAMEMGEQLSVADRDTYMQKVGSLMYLSTGTRPDLAQPVGAVARYMQNPCKGHMDAVNMILQYVAGSRDVGICYGGQEGLIGYCDSDWGGDTDNRISTSGWVYVFNGGAVSWSSKRQPCVATSSQAAEYYAAAGAVEKAIELRQLLPEIGYKVDGAINVWGDNQACLKLLEDPFLPRPAKHIDIKYHFARERVQRKEVAFSWLATANMVADCLTKAVPAAKLRLCRKGMGLMRKGFIEF